MNAHTAAREIADATNWPADRIPAIAKRLEAARRPTLAELRRTMPADDAREAYLGRADWTREDYVAAGRAEFDAHYTESAVSPWAPGNRDRYVSAFVEMHLPRSKGGR